MGVTFTEGRALPREFTRGGGYERYGEGPTFTEAGAVKFMDAISPWKLLEGLFVTKPAQERAAQIALAQAQAQAQGEALSIRGMNTRTMVLVGGGIVGVLAIGLVLMKLGRRSKMSGYRRRARRSRR